MCVACLRTIDQNNVDYLQDIDFKQSTLGEKTKIDN
jgi:hypothetical protein